MPTFVWTAQDRSGKTVLREITVDSVEQSQALLVSEGLTDLKLVGDEITEATRAGFTHSKFLGEELRSTPKEKLQALQQRKKTFWSALSRGIKESKFFCLFTFFLILYELWRGQFLAASLAALGLILWLIFLVCFRLPGIYYAKLTKASDWARWDEVEDLADKCEAIRKFHIIKMPEVELVRHRAKALAGRGRLAEAIALYQPCENQPGCPGWLHKAMLASFCTTAKQHDRALEYTYKSLAEKPSATIYLDLANRLARYHQDATGARVAIAEADKSILTETAKTYQLRCLGIINLLEGNATAARQDLESYLALLERKPNQPYRDGHMSIAKAYLALALARLGELPAAKKTFAEAEKYLIATKETELLADCQKALGKSS